LLAPRKRDHDGIVEARRSSDGFDVCGFVVAVEPMQMDRRNHDLAAREPLQARLTPFRQACEAAAALAQSQLEQKIMTAANDWRRGSLTE
jgi:DNA-binding FadR family transcriptional regulator